jgi:hypothetical protein
VSRCFEQLDCRMVQMSCVPADYGCTRCAELDTSSQDLHCPDFVITPLMAQPTYVYAIPPQMPTSPAHLTCTHTPDDPSQILSEARLVFHQFWSSSRSVYARTAAKFAATSLCMRLWMRPTGSHF